MPCVFPVLSLKVLGFATHGDDDGAMRRHGVAFAGGVVLSFWLLAGILLALRAAGLQLGWGFQLQSPAVVIGLAILFFVMALNLSGVFEFGQALPSAIAGWNARNPHVDDVLSGALAVIVASPCTAPFMGAAIGWALDGDAGYDARCIHRAWRRHGAALSVAGVVPGMASQAAAARSHGWCASSSCSHFRSTRR